MLGLFLKTQAADEKYPVLKRDNLMILIQMQLCQKHKAFSRFFTAFLKSRLYFQYFDKKDDAHRLCNFEITHSESVVRKFVKNPVSENPSTSKMLNVPKHC